MALVAVGWTVIACAGATFVCGDDEDCALSGVPGRCQPTGACAYPDAACLGGHRYAAGAPPELAGRCVGEENDVDDGGAGSTGATSWTPVTADAGESEGDGGAGDEDGDDSDDGVGVDDDAGDDAGTDGGSGGDEGDANASDGDGGDDAGESGEPAAACEQEGEPNDELQYATSLPGTDCSFAGSGAIGDQDAVDVWAPHGDLCNGSTMFLTVDGLGATERCLQYRCTDGSTANLSCGGGSTSIGQTWSQCCGSADYASTIECTSGELELYIVLVGSQVCEDYELSYEAAP